MGFFTKKARSCSAVTTTFCNIYFIIRNEIMSLITEIPSLENSIKTFQNKKQMYQKLNIKCYYCGESTHIISKCKYFLKSNNLIFICNLY